MVLSPASCNSCNPAKIAKIESMNYIDLFVNQMESKSDEIPIFHINCADVDGKTYGR